MAKIHCNRCGKSVSTEVPEETVVRAWVECPECIVAQEKPRTCFDCIHYSVCELSRTIDNFPPGWLRNGPEKEGDTPLIRIDLYTTLAGCCLLFQGREKG